jgi:DNA-binding transcriptional LysR family regulator
MRRETARRGGVGLDIAIRVGMQNVNTALGVHIQIRHIKAFLAVAGELHFGKAASRLNIAQPALSRTIQHLEQMLGVQLLERTTRSVQLTEAGRSFCEHGAKILLELNLAVKCAQRTSDGNSGRLAVGYVDFALAGPVSHVFGKFKRSYPNVEIELIPESPERLTQLLIDRQIDCGFLLGPVRNANLDTRCVQSELPVVVMPVSHRLALRSKIRLKDLADEAFVLPTRNGWQPFYRRFEKLSVKSGFVPNIVQEVQQTEALLAMVAAEIGIAICPASVRTFSRSGVVTQPLVGTPLLFDFHFAWHKDSDSPLVSNFGALVNRFARATKPVDPARIAKLTRLGNVKQSELVDEYALIR